ncbi:MAG: (2Fe-2S)-binding protein [Gemmatimonadota bacterium]|nr:MAG: (2Fe-2S)-binding protein [Gemmatimonadota bacterium]
MPNLKIDDIDVHVPDGTTILEAAKTAGIHIPHFCYHASLKIIATCRVCLVEVENTPKLQTACSTEVRDGMIVSTKNPRVQKARRAVLEFLLINHPLDCPVCDQAGECDLQDYVFDYGAAESRYVEEKRRYPRQDIGSKIVRDMNRCVHCTRCVRFCRDVIGIEEYGVFERGARTTVGTYIDKTLENNYQGSLVELCPVGALTSRDFRFKARVWRLNSAESVCPGCSRGCNVLIDFKDQTVYRFRARQNDDVNGRWLCDEGRMSYAFVNDSNRILDPLHKVDGQNKQVDLDDGLSSIGEILRKITDEHGPDSVGGIASSSCTNEENYLFAKFFREVLGSKNIDFIPAGRGEGSSDAFLIQADKSPNSRGAEEMGCRGEGLDVERMMSAARQGKLKALFVMGQDVIDRFPEKNLVKEALSALELLVVQDTNMNGTAALAHFVLPKASFAEMDGTFTNFEGRVQRIRPAFRHEDVLPGCMTISALVRKMGHDYGYSSASDVFDEIARKVQRYKGLSYDKIGNQGVKI